LLREEGASAARLGEPKNVEIGEEMAEIAS